MKIIFIGTVTFSLNVLHKLLDLGVDVKGVITQKTAKSNADYVDFSGFCLSHNIPCLQSDNVNEPNVIKWIKDISPDIIFCFGFSQMLSKEILFSAPQGVLGYHPALLPKNRGRHPLIWAIVSGLKETGSTFFFMDEGADSGPVLDQVEVPILEDDDADTLYQRVTQVALKQIVTFIPLLESGQYVLCPQDHSCANVWRRRTEQDGCIDFRMTAEAICNLVRALAKPYVGAHIMYQGERVRIWKARVIPCYEDNLESGKILDVDGRKIVIKCCGGAVMLFEHEFQRMPKPGEYL